MQTPEEMKRLLKERRLQQYQQQIFELEMDMVALAAIGKSMEAEDKHQAIESMKLAYSAVEAM